METPLETQNHLGDRVKKMTQYMLALRKVQNQTQAAFLSSLGGLSLQQLNVLNIIGDIQPCTMSTIAENAMLSLSSITFIVEKLVKAGLVTRERTESDRRVVYAQLTPEGQKIYQLQIEHIHTMMERMLQALSGSEQEKFLEIFQKLAQNLR